MIAMALIIRSGGPVIAQEKVSFSVFDSVVVTMYFVGISSIAMEIARKLPGCTDRGLSELLSRASDASDPGSHRDYMR